MDIFFEFGKATDPYKHRDLIDQMRKGIFDGHSCLSERTQKDVRQFRISEFTKIQSIRCEYSFKVELLMKVVIQRADPFDNTSYSLSFTDEVEYMQYESALGAAVFGKNLFIKTFNSAINKRLADIENETKHLKGLLIQK